jgi:proteasome lid subunit RPN8/RPN11
MERTTHLTLSTDLYARVLHHVRESLPGEAVGLLGGTPEGHVEVILPLPNVADGARVFFADPFAQFSALRRLQSEGLQLLAIYHSHPDGGVDPSEADLVYARRWSCAHLIVAIDTETQSLGRVRAFYASQLGSVEDVKIRFG